MKVKIKSLELSTQILIDAARERDIKIDILDYKSNFIRLQKDNRKEYIMQATKTSLDSYIVPLIMENKMITKMLLEEEGISVPMGYEVNNIEEGMDLIQNNINKDIVVKPNSTNFGKGISILMSSSKNQYMKALEYALQYDTTVLIEEFVKGKEYRFLVIGDEVVGILHRVPANVLGDGVLTIQQLVEKKNQDPLRGLGYVTPLEKIQLKEIEVDFLKKQGLTINSIPKKGERIYLRENSNISTGGDSIDFTEEVIEEYKDLAVKITKIIGAKICGLDIMIQDIKEKPTKDNYSIIELNFNPALHIHNYPYIGNNRHVEMKVLDLLGF